MTKWHFGVNCPFKCAVEHQNGVKWHVNLSHVVYLSLLTGGMKTNNKTRLFRVNQVVLCRQFIQFFFCLDTAKVLYLLIIFLYMPPLPKKPPTPTSSSHSLRAPSETRWGSMYSKHFVDPYCIMYFLLFFLLWWQLCVPKPASFSCIQRKVALWRKWSFFMSLVMFLYSCTFILPHTVFFSHCQQGVFH